MATAGPGASPNSVIPAVYTYWGQFIDHDLTANTDADRPGIALDDRPSRSTPTRSSSKSAQPAAPAAGPRQRLRRRAARRRTQVFYDGPRLRVGRVAQVGLRADPTREDDERDLPRIGPCSPTGSSRRSHCRSALRDAPFRRSLAYIGDLRNDSNLITAQLHVGTCASTTASWSASAPTPARFDIAWPPTTPAVRRRTAPRPAPPRVARAARLPRAPDDAGHRRDVSPSARCATARSPTARRGCRWSSPPRRSASATA